MGIQGVEMSQMELTASNVYFSYEVNHFQRVKECKEASSRLMWIRMKTCYKM